MNIAKQLLSAFAALTVALTGCAGNPTGTVDPDAEEQVSEEEVMELTQKTFAADEQHVKMLGRTHAEDGILWLALSASGVEFTMTGTSASVTLAGDSMVSTESNRARFAAYVDGKRVADEMVTETEQTVEIFSSETEKEVTVTLLKLSEAAQSTVGIKSINVTSVGDIAPTPEKELKIEFIGDSITCGYGVDDEDRNHHFSTATEDATKAYAYKTAQLLGADYSLVSYSGHGIVSGYTTKGKKVTAQQVPNMYEQFARSYGNYNGFNVSSVDWDFSSFTPDFVVINLGTNDASYTGGDEELIREYIDAYKAFLATVRKDNPDAYIICALGLMGQDLCKAIDTVVSEYTSESGDERISAFRLTVQDGGKNGYAADWHPTAASHDIAAQEMAAEIQRIMAE